MSGRRYKSEARRGGAELGKRPADLSTPLISARAGLPKEKPSAKRGPELETAKRVGKATLAAAHALAPIAGNYDELRAFVMRGFAMAFTKGADMAAEPIDAHLSTDDHGARRAYVEAVRSLGDYSLLQAEHWGHVHEQLAGLTLKAGHVVSSSERRSGGVHFTPRELTEPIVRRTLEPLFAAYPDRPTLTLRVADPAVGAGAFLLEVVRQLGQRMLVQGEESDLNVAKRLVAIHCCYGTDISPWAIAACRISLYLECRADKMPAGWLNGSLKVGDALVGLTPEQLKAFHWKPKEQSSFDDQRLKDFVSECMRRGALARREEMSVLAQDARRS